MDPGAVCTNQTQVTVTNQTSQSGGLVYYRTSASSSVDTDNDGIDNVTEYDIGTDYQNADSDNDTLNDGDEVLTYATNPPRQRSRNQTAGCRGEHPLSCLCGPRRAALDHFKNP